jgi:hemoglobin
MHRIKILIWLLAALSSESFAGDAPPPVAPPTPPLYTRIGGLAKLADVGEHLAPLLAGDETLKANESLKLALAGVLLPELRFHVTAVLCQLTGGPERYTGAPIPELMRKFNLSDKEAKAALAELKKAGEQAKLPAAEAQELSAVAEDIWNRLADMEARTVRDKARGFSILLPAGWQRQETPGVALAAVAPAKDTKDPKDPKAAAQFHDNLNVIAEDLPVEMTATEFSKAMTLIAARQLKDFKAVETSALTINGEAAEFVYYTHKNTGAPVAVAAYFIVHGKRAYTINCVATEEEFQALKPVYSESVKSFRLE